MNRTLLEKPFEPAQIRQRKGRNGVLDYVEGHSVVQRLNDALDGQWSFEVVQHDIREEEVVVLGRLTADGAVKMSFGASQVTREKGTGQLVSLGDDLKAAATDALKKCATFLGVALHLYADKPLGPVPVPNGNGHGGGAARPPAPAATPGGGASPASRNGAASNSHGARATERQLDAITRIAIAKRLRPTDIDAMSVRAFNRRPGELTRNEASTLIKELSDLKRQN